MYNQLAASLVAETRLAGELVSRQAQAEPGPDLGEEVHSLSRYVAARVTLIAGDGRVLADSSEDAAGLAAMENHGTRPEVIDARRSGFGLARRYSSTLQTDMLYAAVPVRHRSITIVRLALPLTAIEQQLRFVRNAALVALAIALASALALAWITSALLGRRVNAIAAAARRYATGDFAHPASDYEQDELGTVARALDDAVRDIGRHLAAMAEDRARMEAILSGMAEGVFVVNARRRVQLVNRAAREMLKLEEEPTGRPYLESIRHPDVATLVTAALEGRSPAGLELSPARAPERRLFAHATPITGAGSSGAVLVLHDITELRRADLVRRDFVANVSHELRTPLTAIRGYVEALRDDVDPQSRQHFLEIIARHASRMERLAGDLLRLALLEAGQEPVERAPVALEPLLAQAVADLGPAITARQQHVDIRVTPEVATLVTDGGKLQDAVRNLVENASAYSPAGTRIEIAAAACEGRAVVTVADQVPGIPEADLSRIFERFYRVDKARSRESAGTGLGLSIVRHLVDRLGGQVRAANRPEGGALFTVTLPLEGAGPSGA